MNIFFAKKLNFLFVLLTLMIAWAPVSVFASSNYTLLKKAKTIDNDTWINETTRIAVKIAPGSLTGTSEIAILHLTSDSYTSFEGMASVPTAKTYTAGIDSQVPSTVPSAGSNAVLSYTLAPLESSSKVNPDTGKTAYQEWSLTVNSSVYTYEEGLFYLDLKDTFISGETGQEVLLTIDAPSDSPFSPGNITIARVNSPEVEITIDDVNSINDTYKIIDTIHINESQAGALAANPSTNAVELELPNGFTWNKPSSANVKKYWGDDNAVPGSEHFFVSQDGRTLFIKGTGTASSKATHYTLNDLTIDIDETVAKTGDIVVKIDGNSDYSTDRLVIGRYGDYSVKVSIDQVKPLVAGKYDSDAETGTIVIEENSPNTLLPGRELEIWLPDWVKFNDRDLPDFSGSDLTGTLNSDSNDYLLKNRKLTIPVPEGTRTEPYKIQFKPTLEIRAQRYGDIVAVVKGAGLPEQNLIIGKVVPPVLIKTEPTNLKIGVNEQPAADLILAETAPGALRKENFLGKTFNDVYIFLAPGATLSSTPKMEVIEGDLVLENESPTLIARNRTNDGIAFNIQSESTKPSKIRISNIKLNVDRTVAEGPLTAFIGGFALTHPKVIQDFKIANPTEFQFANVITPAPDQTIRGASFVIGHASYKVGLTEKTMDVAPYEKDGRTYLPVRFVAEALDLPENGIVWDENTQTVTLIKGNRVAQLAIGSQVLLLNGTEIMMDAIPELQSGRTMLPVRFIAQAFGAETEWDAATKTVTIQQH